MKNLVLFIVVLIMASCSKSLVYSPSLNLPNQPLKEKEIDIQAGVELLPETRPEELSNQGNSTLGLSGQIGYGFSDILNIKLRGWGDIEGREYKCRSGYSINAYFYKEISTVNRFVIIPRLGFALNGNKVSGYGIETVGIYQAKINNNFSWYGGIGAIWGFRSLEKQLNYNNEMNIPMGFGIVGNLGIGWKLINNLSINCEFSPIYQINTFDDNSQFLLSPNIGIGYTIP